MGWHEQLVFKWSKWHFIVFALDFIASMTIAPLINSTQFNELLIAILFGTVLSYFILGGLIVMFYCFFNWYIDPHNNGYQKKH